MNELKNCPFCGGEAMLTNKLSTDEYGHKLWNVLCFDCGNRTVSYWDKEIVVEKWNNRKPLERVIKRLEKEKSNLTTWAEDEAYKLDINKSIEIIKQELMK